MAWGGACCGGDEKTCPGGCGRGMAAAGVVWEGSRNRLRGGCLGRTGPSLGGSLSVAGLLCQKLSPRRFCRDAVASLYDCGEARREGGKGVLRHRRSVTGGRERDAARAEAESRRSGRRRGRTAAEARLVVLGAGLQRRLDASSCVAAAVATGERAVDEPLLHVQRRELRFVPAHRGGSSTRRDSRPSIHAAVLGQSRQPRRTAL